MTNVQRWGLFLLRVSLGWMYLYAGVEKLANPGWSAAGYIGGAKNLPGLYSFFMSPGVLPAVNLLVEWGLTLLGVALILGIGVRIAAWCGALLMFLFWLALPFPQTSATAFIVDDHIIFISALITLAYFKAGRVYGLANWAGKYLPKGIVE
jgi:thiosulfate dehydrogenase [quinone] large subunit